MAPREIVERVSRGEHPKPGMFRTVGEAILRLIIPLLFGLVLYAYVITAAYMSFKSR
jgi:hypothetical protein